MPIHLERATANGVSPTLDRLTNGVTSSLSQSCSQSVTGVHVCRAPLLQSSQKVKSSYKKRKKAIELPVQAKTVKTNQNVLWLGTGVSYSCYVSCSDLIAYCNFVKFD